jgi:hypothetical protein
MKNRRITSNSLLAIAFAIFLPLAIAGSQAAELFVDSSLLDRAMDIVGTKQTDAVASQVEINRLANSASTAFEEFKRENDTLEALLVLNAEWRQRINRQETNIGNLDESLANVEVVTREIPMLTQKMLTSAEQFIELDYPFHVAERQNRIDFARDAITNPAVSIAERFRQVLVLYQTETSYGRTYETYPDTIELSGVVRDVNIVRVGRIALLYQTTDRQNTGAWDNQARTWVELDAVEYRTAVQAAIGIVSGLNSADVIDLPIMAPESAQ